MTSASEEQAALAEAELAVVGPERFTARDYGPGPVLHIVLFRFRDEVDAAQRDEVATRFEALASSRRRDGEPYIRSIVSGRQLSPERVMPSFELGFVVEFASLGDRNYYLGKPLVETEGCFDPQHDEFKSFVGSLVQELTVFDLQVPPEAGR